MGVWRHATRPGLHARALPGAPLAAGCPQNRAALITDFAARAGGLEVVMRGYNLWQLQSVAYGSGPPGFGHGRAHTACRRAGTCHMLFGGAASMHNCHLPDTLWQRPNPINEHLIS